MKQPILFVGHGSPMNAIEDNIYTQSWKKIGKTLTKPRAILMISAHWITEGETRISTVETPGMIYDMYGFPPELYILRYPAPGSKIIAQEIRDALFPYQIEEDWMRGFDHGVWSTLLHIFPEADVPVIPLSLDYTKSPQWHYEFGQKLKTLREQGILIIGSGNIVHNLGRIDWTDSMSHQWALDFDAKITENIDTGNHANLMNFLSWGEMSRLAHPSYDHLLPLFPLLGASDPTDTIEYFTPEISMGSLSMRSILWH